MQGIYIQHRRPRSKKELRELITTADGRRQVDIEATSLFGNEYDGPLTELPAGKTITFVGPDPYTRRSFYGQLIHTSDDRWKVK